MRVASLCLVVVAALAAPAAADPTDPAVSAVAAPAPAPAPNAIYLELLGKGGLWGLGYTHQLTPRFALGAVGSFTLLDGQRIYSLSPFLTTNLIGTGRHRWFLDTGAQVLRVSTPSPVPEWMGTTSTGVGAQLATGYEYRGRVIVRAYAMAAIGKGGIGPWMGASFGWAF